MSLEGVVAAPDLDPPLPFGGLRGQPSKTKHAYRRAMSRPRSRRMASAGVRRGGNDRVMMRISTSTQKRLIPFLCLAMVAFVGACATDDAPVDRGWSAGFAIGWSVIRSARTDHRPAERRLLRQRYSRSPYVTLV